ncbi:fluoride efflux transporter CrcB [Glaciecola sp. KUL10]|uniref:fluoride efflux transporter CrcB n=1 Tax=Glaciecola sp. (strain KUL10) TaxID=2161813 RepID=UPI000D78A1F2|nr:fluoride efflux transporter CrcB [Glaciecola sp. KUL10]GBL02974.1 camphor resistance protein CrcB [Glaciecola sp. KUL10]
MTPFQTYLAICIGGAIGAPLRWYLVQITTNWLGKGFPFGTLAVNVLGSFALGVLYSFIHYSDSNSWLKAMVGIGLLGALTTFSTFSFDTYLLIQQGQLGKAILNILINVSLCVFALWLALQLFKG